MKSRFWIFILTVVSVLLFWILWPSPVHPVRAVEQKQVVSPAVNPAPVAQGPQSAWPTNPSSAEILKHRNPEKLKQAQEQEAKQIEALNRDINFYGQTVDQDDNPLPGVQIKMIVPHYLGYSLDGKMIHADRTSDQNGLFDIHDANVTGDGFDMEYMSKKGYTLEPMARSFGPMGGAPGNPVIFKLWRNDIKEPLLTGSRALQYIPDGRVYTIGITNGVISESSLANGDMTLWVKRPERIVLVQRFDWSSELQLIGRGLAEEPDLNSAMYVAPIEGYSNTFHFDARNGWSDTTGVRRFYLKLKNRDYGRASIEIMAYYNKQIPGLIRIEYAINPIGSRVLRYSVPITLICSLLPCVFGERPFIFFSGEMAFLEWVTIPASVAYMMLAFTIRQNKKLPPEQ